MTKKTKSYTQQNIVNLVIEYTWEEGYYSKHDFENDVLERISKAIHKDYPIKRFNVVGLDIVNLRA